MKKSFVISEFKHILKINKCAFTENIYSRVYSVQVVFKFNHLSFLSFKKWHSNAFEL